MLSEVGFQAWQYTLTPSLIRFLQELFNRCLQYKSCYRKATIRARIKIVIVDPCMTPYCHCISRDELSAGEEL